MKIAILRDTEMPFVYKGTVTWYHKGDEFEIIEERQIKEVKGVIEGKWYKLKKYGCIFDGLHNPHNFDVIVK